MNKVCFHDIYIILVNTDCQQLGPRTREVNLIEESDTPRRRTTLNMAEEVTEQMLVRCYKFLYPLIQYSYSSSLIDGTMSFPERRRNFSKTAKSYVSGIFLHTMRKGEFYSMTATNLNLKMRIKQFGPNLGVAKSLSSHQRLGFISKREYLGHTHRMDHSK